MTPTVLLIGILLSTMHVAADRVHIGFSGATLLSGDVSSCQPDPSPSSCKRGLASALAVFRNRSATLAPDAEIFIPSIDKDTAFVQAHPLNVGANVKIFKNFSISYFIVKPYVFSDLARVEATPYFQVSTPQIMGTNLLLDKSNPMYYYISKIPTIGTGNHTTAILSALRTDSVFSQPAVELLQNTVQYIRQSSTKIVVLLCDDKLKPASEYFNEMYPYTPDVVIGLRASSDQPCVTVNGSFFCDIAADSAKLMSSIQIDSVVVNGTPRVTSVSYVNADISLSDDQKDAMYYEQQAVLLEEANAAIANDPVVGSSSVTMPSGGRTDGTYPCYLGECGQGTLYMRSFLMKYPADFSVGNSGAYRGSGWSPGPLRQSNVWEAAPYSNTYCTGRMLGLRVWQLFDTSMSKARFSTEFSATGDRLLQASGVEVEVNPSIADEEHRLIALRIYNNVTGVFEPVDRLRYYTFTTDNYLCESMDDLSPFFQAPLYDGETVTVHEDDIVQTGVAAYLKANDPYDDLLSGYLRKVTSPDALVWSAAEVDCGTEAYWSAGVSSCVACPDGMVVVGSTCTTKEEEQNLDLIWQIAVPVGVVLLGAIVAFVVCMECRRRKSARNIGNAPRGGDVAIVFTDIQSSTKLWGTVPASMAVALDMHHALIRAALEKHGGYEVKTVGDCFMMALHTADDAVSLCVSIQKALAAAEWPAGINEMYLATSEEELMEIDDDPSHMVVAEGAWNGLRVRMGINFGPTEAVFDEVTKGYDYYGPTVNVAARVESTAAGGQILISRAVEAALGSKSWSMELFTAVELRGVSGKTELLQVKIPTLERTFVAPDVSVSRTNRKASAVSLCSSDMGALKERAGGSRASFMEQSILVKSGRSMGEELTLSKGQQAVSDSLDACLRIMAAGDKARVVESLCKAWRVKYDVTRMSESLIEISMRAGGRVERNLNNMVAIMKTSRRAGSFSNAEILWQTTSGLGADEESIIDTSMENSHGAGSRSVGGDLRSGGDSVISPNEIAEIASASYRVQ